MGPVATGHAPEDGLRLAVVCIHVPALGAGSAGVMRRHYKEHAPMPDQLVCELAAELEPGLIQAGLVQASYEGQGLLRIGSGRWSTLPVAFNAWGSYVRNAFQDLRSTFHFTAAKFVHDLLLRSCNMN
jgi:hypothetical protein